MNSLEETNSKTKTPEISRSQNTFMSNISPQLQQSRPMQITASNPIFDVKTLTIIVLVVFIILLYLGINLLNIAGDTLQGVMNILTPFFSKILSTLGYSTGEVINASADIASDTIKTGVDVAEEAVKNVGNILIDASEETDHNKPLKTDLENRRTNIEPSADIPEDTIQKSITSGKNNWCLVGEYQNKRGCVPITEGDKCLSGQVFPNQYVCLNPTFTPH